METVTLRQATRCNLGAVVLTMMLGVCFSLFASAVWAVGHHVIYAAANPRVAAPFLGLELYIAVVGGLLLSSVAVVGGAVALAVTDHRLVSSRFVQGVIAGVGAALGGLGLFIYLGPTIVFDGGEIAGILAFVAAASFGLMCVRASAHRVVT
jgi:hypothetical protein